MKFRRRSKLDEPIAEESSLEGSAEEGTSAAQPAGPLDVDEADQEVERIDLGSLLIAPVEGRDVRLQVDEATGTVQSVLLAAEDGALEVRAFAAPRGGDLWADVRPQIAADMAQRGGTTTEREGSFGTELLCQISVELPDGSTGVQPSRIIGVNGPRWLLRATLLGRPAMEFDDDTWEQALSQVVVRRGNHALPVGEALPLVLPDDAQRVG